MQGKSLIPKPLANIVRSLELSSQTFPYLFFLFIVSKGCFLLADDLVVNLLYLSFAWFLTICTQKSTNSFSIQNVGLSANSFSICLRTKYIPPRAPPRKASTINTLLIVNPSFSPVSFWVSFIITQRRRTDQFSFYAFRTIPIHSRLIHSHLWLLV